MPLRNRLVLSIIGFALTGCGSRSTTVVPPPNGGFTNGNLKGTYVFSFSGKDTVAVIPEFFTMVGNLFYYVADSSTVIFIDADTTQAGVGTFLRQNASPSQAAVAHTESHLSMLRAMARPGGRRRR